MRRPEASGRRTELEDLPDDVDRLAAGREDPAGGGDRDRTGDLKLAKLALSQLSYAPGPADRPCRAGIPRRRAGALT